MPNQRENDEVILMRVQVAMSAFNDAADQANKAGYEVVVYSPPEEVALHPPLLVAVPKAIIRSPKAEYPDRP